MMSHESRSLAWDFADEHRVAYVSLLCEKLVEIVPFVHCTSHENESKVYS
jgi:hypothetical protein